MRASRIMVTAALIAVSALSAFARGNEARVRVLHASPDAPAVDVLVEGAPAFRGVAFGEITDYAKLPAGLYDVQVVPAGASSPVVIDLTGPNAVNLFYNRSYTAVALNTLNEIEPLLLEDDGRPAPIPFARVRFVHASPDAPAVDIAVKNGPVLFRNVAFKGVGSYIEVPRGTYDLEVRPTGSSVVALALPGVRLDGGTTLTVFATGLLSGSPTLGVAVAVDAVNPALLKGRDDRPWR